MHLQLLFFIILAAVSCSGNISSCRSWLDDPCTSEITTNCRNKRHSYITVLKHQINIFISQIRNNLKKIEHLYKDIPKSNLTITHVNLSGLKTRSILQKMLKRTDTALEEFLSGLEQFACAMMNVKDMSVGSEDQLLLKKRRDHIYMSGIYQMRSLLCEVHYSLEVSKGVAATKAYSQVMEIRLPQESSLNAESGHALDKLFFKKTLHFLVKAANIYVKPYRKDRKSKIMKKRT